MWTILLLILSIVLVFLLLICVKTKTRTPSIRGGRPPLEADPEDLAVDLREYIDIPPALYYVSPIESNAGQSSFYTDSITTFYTFKDAGYFTDVLSSLGTEWINAQIGTPNLSPEKAAPPPGFVNYTDINFYTIGNMEGQPKGNYRRFFDDLSSDSYQIYINKINYNSSSGALLIVLRTMVLIAAEYEYPVTTISPIQLKILLLVLFTFLMRCDIANCPGMIGMCIGYNEIARGFRFSIDDEEELATEQLFKIYQKRLKIITINESKDIFAKGVIKQDLEKLQRDGMRLEEMLEAENNKQNLDKLKCVQNRIKNKIKSL